MILSGRIVESIKRHGVKARGRHELITYLTGRTLTRSEAIRAKCSECMGFFADGKADCRAPSCPVYRFMPYRHGTEAVSAVLEGAENNGSGTKQRATRGKVASTMHEVLKAEKKHLQRRAVRHDA